MSIPGSHRPGLACPRLFFARGLARALVVLAAVGAIGGFGCSLLVPLDDDLVGGPVDAASTDATGAPSSDDAADATGVVDGALDSSLGDAFAPDGDAGVLYRTTFDLGCSGWAAHQSTLSTETTSVLTPPAACRVCPVAGSEADFGIFAPVPNEVVGDASVIAEAKGRAADAASMTLVVVLYTAAEDFERGTNQVGTSYGNAAVAKAVPSGTTFFVKGEATSSTCLLVDEVSFRR